MDETDCLWRCSESSKTKVEAYRDGQRGDVWGSGDWGSGPGFWAHQAAEALGDWSDTWIDAQVQGHPGAGRARPYGERVGRWFET